MKEKISISLLDEDNKIELSLIEMLILELKGINELFVKKYVTFGVVLAFLANPIYGIYSQKFANIAFSYSPVLGIVLHVCGIFIILQFTFILVNSKEIYLGITKDYYARLDLIEQLNNIKVDNLLKSKKLNVQPNDIFKLTSNKRRLNNSPVRTKKVNNEDQKTTKISSSK